MKYCSKSWHTIQINRYNVEYRRGFDCRRNRSVSIFSCNDDFINNYMIPGKFCNCDLWPSFNPGPFHYSIFLCFSRKKLCHKKTFFFFSKIYENRKLSVRISRSFRLFSIKHRLHNSPSGISQESWHCFVKSPQIRPQCCHVNYNGHIAARVYSFTIEISPKACLHLRVSTLPSRCQAGEEHI